MARRIVIVGGPHVGKTTLAKRLRDECGITNTHHSDDVKHLGWSESSTAVSDWFNEGGEWIVEGVQTARALRKWLAASPYVEFNADVLILDRPFGELLQGQKSMAKGVQTVFSEIESDLISRGARIHRLGNPDDAVRMFLTKTGEPETTGEQKFMLKSTYKTLDEIPEGDRQHYKKIADRYVLELDGDHPVQAQVTTITQEKRDELQKVNQRAATAEAEVQTLKTQAANQPTLPSGHVPVPADKAKLLDAVEALGKPDEIKTKLEQLETLTTENETLKKTETLRKVADSGIGGKKLKVSVLQTLDTQAGGLTYEERDVTVTKDGKTAIEKVYHVKDNNKWVPLSEYVEAHWKDFNASLLSEPVSTGTRIVGQGPDDRTPGTISVYDKIRKDAEDRAKKVETNAIPLEQRLGMAHRSV